MKLKKDHTKFPDPAGAVAVFGKARDFSKHPFFAKKVSADKAYLKSVGLPYQLFGNTERR